MYILAMPNVLMLVYKTQIGACNDLMGPGACLMAHFHQGSYTAAEMFAEKQPRV